MQGRGRRFEPGWLHWTHESPATYDASPGFSIGTLRSASTIPHDRAVQPSPLGGILGESIREAPLEVPMIRPAIPTLLLALTGLHSVPVEAQIPQGRIELRDTSYWETQVARGRKAALYVGDELISWVSLDFGAHRVPGGLLYEPIDSVDDG